MRTRGVGVHVGDAGDPVLLGEVHQSHELEFVGDVGLSFALYEVPLSFTLPNFEVSFLAVDKIK